jgi:hypothetical protein
MGFLDTLKDKATDLAQAGVAQSKRLAEIAKLKADNMAQEDAIKKGYIELGKLYYAERGAAPEGAYGAACEKITAAKAAIETNNDRIAELKEVGDEDPDVVAEVDIETETEADTETSAEKTEAPVEEAEPKTQD